MPTYTMKNKKTGEVNDMFISISKMEEMTSSGEWEQIIGSPNLVTHVNGTLSKAGSGWSDLLKGVKKGSGKNNTIKV